MVLALFRKCFQCRSTQPRACFSTGYVVCKTCIQKKHARMRRQKERMEYDLMEPEQSSSTGIFCLRCGTLKDISHFERDKRMRQGVRNTCKACRKAMKYKEPAPETIGATLGLLWKLMTKRLRTA